MQKRTFFYPLTLLAAVSFLLIFLLTLSGYRKPANRMDPNILYMKNPKGGPVLGYAEGSGVKIIEHDGFFFKDLNKNGKLDPYEDWRLSADVRAKNLASLMTVEQIAGLMLYSRHQAVPSSSNGLGVGTYHGKPPNRSPV